MGDSEQRGSARLYGREEDETEFNRVVAFSDGVFAIAITLLVLSLEVPRGADDLGAELRSRVDELAAYALSFAVLGKLWLSHHRFFGSVARFDGRLIGLNLLYLAFVALIPFTTDLYGDYSNERVAVIIYAVSMIGVTVAYSIEIAYAYRKRLMRPNARQSEHLYAGPPNFLVAAVFAASIPVALLSPTAASLMWLGVFLVGRNLGQGLHRRRRARAGRPDRDRSG